MSALRDQLFQEILIARKRVYAAGRPTPLDRIDLPGLGEVWVKREDMSPIHAYKWRGAFNRMATLSDEERARGVVCASAGNHAQGVALAACKLGTHATIYMPASAPRMKQHAVRQIGGEHVTIVLHGDNYSAAAGAATAFAQEQGKPFIHAFDDLATMGGQGTLADEIVMSGEGPFDVAYIQIGGGGLAASVACWLKTYYPEIRIVGVEGVAQAKMAAAVKAGEPVELPYVDVFCDGTAVKKAGKLTYALCAELIDEFITVTNEEVCAAIELLWSTLRCVAEPAGALGLAGLIKHQSLSSSPSVPSVVKKSLCILAGANVDFEQLAWISQHAGIGAARRRYYRFDMGEAPGGLLHLLDVLLEGVNIVEVQYGKIDPKQARPVIGFEASPPQLALLDQRLTDAGVPHQDVTSQPDVEFRIIQYAPELFHLPYFITLEFPERPGALRDFLLSMAEGNHLPNLCYFNYTHTGEQVGRALIGFEFDTAEARAHFRTRLHASPHIHHELGEEVIHRIL